MPTVTTDTLFGSITYGSVLSFGRRLTGGSLQFTGMMSDAEFTINGATVSRFPFEEMSGTTAYDVTGNGNHGTIVGATWASADSISSWNHSRGFTRVSDTYQVTEPADGWERTFNPVADDTAKLMDSLATVAYDQAGNPDGITYTVTPTTWTRTYDPDGSSVGELCDVLGTLMQDITDGNTTDVWTVEEPDSGRIRVYDPNTDNINQTYDFTATLLLDLRDAGIIG